jgi:hypothetical protein
VFRSAGAAIPMEQRRAGAGADRRHQLLMTVSERVEEQRRC